MSGKKSRDKGKAGERELARILRDFGYDDCKRGQQFCGASGDADVIGLDGIHIEVKRTEALRLYDAMAQAKADTRPGEKPAVFHRKNNHKWVVVQELDDWIEIYKEWEAEKNK